MKKPDARYHRLRGSTVQHPSGGGHTLNGSYMLVDRKNEERTRPSWLQLAGGSHRLPHYTGSSPVSAKRPTWQACSAATMEIYFVCFSPSQVPRSTLDTGHSEVLQRTALRHCGTAGSGAVLAGSSAHTFAESTRTKIRTLLGFPCFHAFTVLPCSPQSASRPHAPHCPQRAHSSSSPQQSLLSAHGCSPWQSHIPHSALWLVVVTAVYCEGYWLLGTSRIISPTLGIN